TAELTTFSVPKGGVCTAGGKEAKGPLNSVELSRHATVASDRTDYPPNTTVQLTGTGWSPGERVTLTIRESDGDPDTVVNVTADANGSISNSGFQTNNGDKHEAFLVKA